MNDEKWGDLKIKLNDKFNDVTSDIRTEDREDDVGNVITSTIETLVFTSPLGKLKLERTTRPKIIDRKTHYHKGAGVGKVEYITSDDETTSHIDVYKKDAAGEWEIMELPAESISF